MNVDRKRIRQIWHGMIRRCYNPTDTSYSRYGGRGIVVCEEWQNDFNSFLNWSLSHGYDANLSLDRINNDGDYEPSNCRWATAKQQQNNKRDNVIITAFGKTKTATEWSELAGIDRELIYHRINRNWDCERAITLPPLDPNKSITCNGITKLMKEWESETGINRGNFNARVADGWTVEEALFTPIKTRRLSYNGKNLTVSEWAKETGLREKVIRRRLFNGWSVEDALTKTPKPIHKIEFQGEVHSCRAWEHRLGAPKDFVLQRYNKGKTMEEIVQELKERSENRDPT